jgi:hypothetical protein
LSGAILNAAGRVHNRSHNTVSTIVIVVRCGVGGVVISTSAVGNAAGGVSHTEKNTVVADIKVLGRRVAVNSIAVQVAGKSLTGWLAALIKGGWARANSTLVHGRVTTVANSTGILVRVGI